MDLSAGGRHRPGDRKLRALERMVCDLRERTDDLEKREKRRRKNIHIIGLPEEVEGEDPTCFFETWLPKILQIQTKSDQVKLERAHHSLALTPPSTQRSRLVLVSYHNYQDTQRVRNVAWDMGRKNQAMKYGEATVMIFQDFTAAVLRQRKA